MTTFGPYPARCVTVHDGDTATFDIDLGFGVELPAQSWTGTTLLACRVKGINAPELNTPEGKTARDYAQTILRPGDICQLTSHGWDKYGGRYDGTITLPDGRDFATVMLETGHAVPFNP
jgi:endonuclease YncB( thermonuclease family)